ncbi:unnamed protein product [Effrenium voratum]|nr:unnamed protein product [Effrenium voratum]
MLATSWTPLSFTGEAPKPLYGHTATYCPTAGGGAMIVFGGYNRGEFFADLWRLDFQEQRWQLLKPAGAAPPARRGHSATFCASTDSILVFGGLVDGRGRNDVWRFMIKEGPDGRWQPATAGGGPAARRGHSAVRERAGAVLIFGGRDGVGGRKLFNDLWKLNAEATSWTPLSPTGEAPEPRAGHTATYCPTAGGGAMIVHGGEGYGGECLADLWRLDLQANCWERLNPVGQGPSPRMQHSSILVPEINCLVVFGGVDEGPGLKEPSGFPGAGLGELRQQALRGVMTYYSHWILQILRRVAAPVLKLTSLPPALCCAEQLNTERSGNTAEFLLFHFSLSKGCGAWEATSWTALSPTGEAPKPQYGHTATYCPTDGGGAMIVHGGPGPRERLLATNCAGHRAEATRAAAWASGEGPRLGPSRAAPDCEPR